MLMRKYWESCKTKWNYFNYWQEKENICDSTLLKFKKLCLITILFWKTVRYFLKYTNKGSLLKDDNVDRLPEQEQSKKTEEENEKTSNCFSFKMLVLETNFKT